MNSNELENVLKFIAHKFSIEYCDILDTLSNHSLLDSYLSKKHKKITKFKNPAVKLIAEKYKVDTSMYHSKNKMGITDLKIHIQKWTEEQKNKIFKYLVYMVFMKKLGCVGYDLAKIYLET